MKDLIIPYGIVAVVLIIGVDLLSETMLENSLAIGTKMFISIVAMIGIVVLIEKYKRYKTRQGNSRHLL